VGTGGDVERAGHRADRDVVDRDERAGGRSGHVQASGGAAQADHDILELAELELDIPLLVVTAAIDHDVVRTAWQRHAHGRGSDDVAVDLHARAAGQGADRERCRSGLQLREQASGLVVVGPGRRSGEIELVKVGGFAQRTEPLVIGGDVEQRERVRHELVRPREVLDRGGVVLVLVGLQAERELGPRDLAIVSRRDACKRQQDENRRCLHQRLLWWK